MQNNHTYTSISKFDKPSFSLNKSLFNHIEWGLVSHPIFFHALIYSSLLFWLIESIIKMEFSRMQVQLQIKGNGDFCGGIPKFQLPKCKNKKSMKKKLTLTLKLIIFVLFGLIGVTLVLLYLKWFNKFVYECIIPKSPKCY